MHLPGASIRLGLPRRAASRWVIPGSRLLPHVLAGFVMERIREGDETRVKAAPLQALRSHAVTTPPPFSTTKTGSSGSSFLPPLDSLRD